MKLIVITIRIDVDHDWCKVRRLLKCLLRSYGLRCVDIAPEQAEAKKRQERKLADSVVETLPQQKGKSRDKVGDRVGVSGKSEPSK